MAKNVSLTSYASQLAEIDRQKRLANLLQTQAQEPIEIQSYKGTQAAIPLTSVLAKLLNQVGGQMKEARAIKREGELSAKDREVAQNLIGGRVSTAKISDIPQPRSLGVAMGEMPQGPTPESRFMQQVQAAPMGELPPLPTPGPGLTPEARFMQRAAPQTIPSPGAMMNIPSQGAPMGMPPSAPPMGGPLRPPLPMMNIPSQAKDRARTPTEQIEAGQRALLDPMSGPVARAMAERVILRGETKQDAEEARAIELADRDEGRDFAENQRLLLKAANDKRINDFVAKFSQFAPKDASGKPLVDPMQFAALAETGDLAGAVKLYTDAGGDYRVAQEQIRQFNQTLALQRQQLQEQINNNRANRQNALNIANIKGTDLKYTPSSGQKAIIGDRESLNSINEAIRLVTANKDAFGVRNYIGNMPINIFDPSGTKARAAVTSVSGVQFHALAGAAQPAKEIERLKPHIPSVTDDANSIISKLERLRSEFEYNLNVTEEFYSPQNGYKPVAPSSSENVINYDNKGNPVP